MALEIPDDISKQIGAAGDTINRAILSGKLTPADTLAIRAAALDAAARMLKLYWLALTQMIDLDEFEQLGLLEILRRPHTEAPIRYRVSE